MSRARRAAGRGPFLVSAAVLVLALWSSGAPAMVYPVYAAEWALSPLVTTSVFAVYPVALVVVLVVFGSLSDHVGRRALLVAGVATIAAGALVLALAPGLPWLYVGRVVQGVGVGLAISPASASLVEHSPAGRSGRASAVNTAATALGTGLAILVGGALVQHAPWPAHLPFWVLLAVAVLVLVAVCLLPRTSGVRATGRWAPRPVAVPRGIRLVFTVGTLAVAAAFAMGAVFLSLGAQIAKDVIGTDDALLAAAVISGWALIIVAVSWVARRLSPRASTAWGGLASLVGLLLLLPAGSATSLPLFLAASLVSGTGYGLLFLGGLSLLNAHAPAQHRAGTLSAAYLVAYLGQGLTAVAVGLTATLVGLDAAVRAWSPGIAALCGVAALLALVVRPPRARTARASGPAAPASTAPAPGAEQPGPRRVRSGA